MDGQDHGAIEPSRQAPMRREVDRPSSAPYQGRYDQVLSQPQRATGCRHQIDSWVRRQCLDIEALIRRQGIMQQEQAIIASHRRQMGSKLKGIPPHPRIVVLDIASIQDQIHDVVPFLRAA